MICHVCEIYTYKAISIRRSLLISWKCCKLNGLKGAFDCHYSEIRINEITLPFEVNLRRYFYNILTGNNDEILLCILYRIKIFIGVNF